MFFWFLFSNILHVNMKMKYQNQKPDFPYIDIYDNNISVFTSYKKNQSSEKLTKFFYSFLSNIFELIFYDIYIYIHISIYSSSRIV